MRMTDVLSTSFVRSGIEMREGDRRLRSTMVCLYRPVPPSHAGIGATD